MAIIQYPVFVKGQTLTDDDLNDLRDALDGTDRSLGRLIGFGIDCGLGGTVKDRTLIIDAGLAIDQLGHALEVSAPIELKIPPDPSPDEPPKFLQAGPKGFTPVLQYTVTDIPAVKCNEAGCEGHAKQREVATTLVVYPGRLSDAVLDFGDEPLLQQEPVLVRKGGSVSGAFIGLRDAIVNRLGTTRLDTDAMTKLSTMTIEDDLTAIQGYKAGFLNQVFFVALDLLRCERVTGAGCVTPDDGVGVALGWLHQTGTKWEWACDFRHDWQVPTGVAMALIGGRCVSPCDLYRDELNAMINAFEVPVTPAKEDPPDGGGGGFDVCFDRDIDVLYSGRYFGRVGIDPCTKVITPPPKLPPNWRDKWVKVNPKPGPWPEERNLLDIYGQPPVDWTISGTIGLERAVGKRAPDMALELEKVLKDAGNESQVRVVAPKDIAGLDNYRASTVVSAADTVVLTQDALGKVVGVGSIPAATTIRGAVAEIPQATATANRAETTAKEALDTAGVLTEHAATVDQQLLGLGTFQENILSWQQTVDFKVGGFDAALDAKALEAVNGLQLRLMGQVEERIGTSLTAFKTEFEGQQLEIGGKVSQLGEEVAGLSGQLRVVARDAERSNVRIDQVLVPTRGIAPPGGVVLEPDMVGVIGSMRESILAAATPNQLPKVTAALAESDEAFKRISEASAVGPVDIATNREAIATVLASMTTAVEAAGAPAANVAGLRRDTARLLERG